MDNLSAISPIDGRYYSKTKDLSQYFSEQALIYHRLLVEIRYLQALSAEPQITELPPLSEATDDWLESLLAHFDSHGALRVKSIEKTTNHDLKAVEYYLSEKLQSGSQPLAQLKNFIHFACTSEDINNTAYALMVKNALNEVLIPVIESVNELIHKLAHQFADCPMLSRTHGQSASPTTMGKELANFSHRLQRLLKSIKACQIEAKFNGAVGNYNAHKQAYPEVNWPAFSKQFIEKLGLTFNPYTTQIETHDWIANLAHCFVRLNTVLTDLSRDIWHYISLGYFKLAVVGAEVGSSTMPHKVNPIDFENAEGNLGLANALFDYFAQKLPISRLQRDLSDSTVLRNLGVAFAYNLIALQSLNKGLNKLSINTPVLEHDLNENWPVLAEAIQTVMRRYQIDAPYEQLKDLTRGQAISKEVLVDFIQTLNIPENEKTTLLALTPSTYTGYAKKLALEV